MASIRSRVCGAHVRHVQLDLADLSSLKASVDRLDLDHLDAVVHNAGVALDDPPRQETADGHELMSGTNHLGHFALTQWLAPLLSTAPSARIVTVGSFAARSERLLLDDPQSTRDYRPKRAYGRSKLAQMCFGFALDHRLRPRQYGAQRGGPPRRRAGRPHPAPPAVAQGKESGPWPVVRAVLDAEVEGGQLWGPRVFGLRGTLRREPVPSHMSDPTVAAELWATRSELTGTDPHLGFQRPGGRRPGGRRPGGAEVEVGDTYRVNSRAHPANYGRVRAGPRPGPDRGQGRTGRGRPGLISC